MKLDGLNLDELNLLKLCVKESEPQLMYMFSNGLNNIVTEENRKRIIGAVTNKLQRQGFDIEWEPTDLGLRLENLISLLLKSL